MQDDSRAGRNVTEGKVIFIYEIHLFIIPPPIKTALKMSVYIVTLSKLINFTKILIVLE